MMIAARLAGGNLFLPFLWWGILWWGIFGSTRSTRSTRIFLRGFCGGGVVGCVLDCKCWKKLKND